MNADAAPSSTVPEPCSFCGRPSRWELTATTFVCGPECEARWAEQFCQGCRANVAEGEDCQCVEQSGVSVMDRVLGDVAGVR